MRKSSSRSNLRRVPAGPAGRAARKFGASSSERPKLRAIASAAASTVPCVRVREQGSLVRLQRGALMFIETPLLYPCVLAALCLGTGLLVDHLAGRFIS